MWRRKKSSIGTLQDLKQAIKNQSTNIIERMVKKHGKQILQTTFDNEFFGCQALSFAVTHSTTEMVEFLLGQGAEVNDEYGWTALHQCAITDERLDKAQLLIKHGANINAVCTRSGDSPLHRACQKGARKIAELLLQNGCDIIIKCMSGKLAKDVITSKEPNRSKILEAFRLWEEKRNEERQDVKEALDKNSTDLIEGLVKKHGKRILDTRVYHNPFDKPPLVYAVEYSKAKMIEFLLKQGAQVNGTDSATWTPLHYCAVSDDCLDKAQLLIQHGANINAATRRGETPLHKACWTGAFKIVELLLQHGCNTSIKSRNGKSAKENISSEEPNKSKILEAFRLWEEGRRKERRETKVVKKSLQNGKPNVQRVMNESVCLVKEEQGKGVVQEERDVAEKNRTMKDSNSPRKIYMGTKQNKQENHHNFTERNQPTPSVVAHLDETGTENPVVTFDEIKNYFHDLYYEKFSKQEKTVCHLQNRVKDLETLVDQQKHEIEEGREHKAEMASVMVELQKTQNETLKSQEGIIRRQGNENKTLGEQLNSLFDEVRNLQAGQQATKLSLNETLQAQDLNTKKSEIGLKEVAMEQQDIATELRYEQRKQAENITQLQTKFIEEKYKKGKSYRKAMGKLQSRMRKVEGGLSATGRRQKKNSLTFRHVLSKVREIGEDVQRLKEINTWHFHINRKMEELVYHQMNSNHTRPRGQAADQLQSVFGSGSDNKFEDGCKARILLERVQKDIDELFKYVPSKRKFRVKESKTNSWHPHSRKRGRKRAESNYASPQNKNMPCNHPDETQVMFFGNPNNEPLNGGDANVPRDDCSVVKTRNGKKFSVSAAKEDEKVAEENKNDDGNIEFNTVDKRKSSDLGAALSDDEMREGTLVELSSDGEENDEQPVCGTCGNDMPEDVGTMENNNQEIPVEDDNELAGAAGGHPELSNYFDVGYVEYGANSHPSLSTDGETRQQVPHNNHNGQDINEQARPGAVAEYGVRDVHPTDTADLAVDFCHQGPASNTSS